MRTQKYTYLIIAFLCFASGSFAQNSNRIFKNFTQKDNQFQIEVNDGMYHIRFFTAEMVETSFVARGEKFKNKSHAVVLQTEEVETKVLQTEEENKIETEGISVVIQKEPFQIKYFYEGKELISEKQGYFTSPHQPMDLVKDNINVAETRKISFNLTPDEVLYGGGERALPMNRRGYRLPLYNRAHYGYETHSELMNYTMPLVLSSKKYAIHFDNAPIGYLDLDSNQDNTLTYETISGRMTYQIIAADDWEDLMDNYTDLTGKQPMLPRWTLGNFASRFGYHSQAETEKTIADFRKEKMPVDAVVLDLYWFGKEIKGTMGNLQVDKDSFPDMLKMIKNFDKKGVKTVLITEPFVLTTSKRWGEAVAKEVLAKDSLGKPATYDFYFGNTGIVDIYSKKGNDWFKNIYKDLLAMGVAGLWGDLGEPEVLPSWVKFTNGTADEIHNVYGHDWAKLVYETFRENNPDQRPFILMRAGSSGSQRYGIIPWSGDVSRSWGGLQSQPKIALQMGMQGLGYMHSDLGGFAGDLLDDELYARWLQYGVFQPVFRPHAQESLASEAVYRSEKAKENARKAIELRYRLLPYNYQLMFENHDDGMPLMRPIFFENEDKSTYTAAYLWGDDILVAPVLEKGKTEQEVYFPQGATWFDFYTGEKIKGGQTKIRSLSADRIPTFVRGGAFVPMAQPMQNTSEYDSNQWEVHFYYDSDLDESEREFYNDDGKTAFAYVQEKFEMIEMEAEQEGRWLEIELEAEIGENYSATEKKFHFVIHGLTQGARKVKWGRKKIKSQWDADQKILSFDIDWQTNQEKEIRILLNT